MRFFLQAGVYALGLCAATPVFAQSANVHPLRASAGAVLTFYSQTRLNPPSRNALDALPKGTELKVKLHESIDSRIDRDGFEFHGSLTSPLMLGSEVLVRADAEAHGLLVLLRSRNHPEGFRYELLITSITENGKNYELTASLNPSFADTTAAAAAGVNPNPAPRESGEGRQAAVGATSESKN